MQVYASANWAVTLQGDERFRVTGKNYGGSPTRTIEVAIVRFRSYLGGRLELAGPVIKKNGMPGERDARVEVGLDDDRVPQRVLDEVNRMRRLEDRFISKAKAALL